MQAPARRRCVCGRVHIYGHIRQCTHVCAAVYRHGFACECVCVRSRKRSRPCISVALPAHTVVSHCSPCQIVGGEWRDGMGEQVAVTLVRRTSSGPMW